MKHFFMIPRRMNLVNFCSKPVGKRVQTCFPLREALSAVLCSSFNKELLSISDITVATVQHNLHQRPLLLSNKQLLPLLVFAHKGGRTLIKPSKMDFLKHMTNEAIHDLPWRAFMTNT